MPSYMRHDRCTVQMRGGTFCDAPSDQDVPFPICTRHTLRLYRRVRERLAGAVSDPAAALALMTEHMKAEQDAKARHHDEQTWCVYYAEVGQFVKIGVTSNLRQRIYSYPPFSRLLASEPGGYELENKRLMQFQHLLAHGKEWFDPGADLLRFIKELKSGSLA